MTIRSKLATAAAVMMALASGVNGQSQSLFKALPLTVTARPTIPPHRTKIALGRLLFWGSDSVGPE